MGCGEEKNDAGDADVVLLECGPNARLHGGLGNIEPHCDCNAGFQMYDGVCVAEAAPDAGGANDDAPEGGQAGGNDNGDAGQGGMPDLPPRALPVSCWRPPGAECDPRDPTECDLASGETCDIAQMRGEGPNLVCLPGPNSQGLGDACQPADGPYCTAGLHCAPPGVCKRFCCDDGDCSDGLRCRAFIADAGSLGICDDGTSGPSCAGPGASCQTGSDCCSNDCHLGHCH